MVADASSLGVNPRKGDLAPARPRVQSYRFIRAYWTTFQVLFAYLALGLGRKIFGQGWYDDRIASAHRRNALRVERTILKLQGLFIKVGQLLSIMANFLPEQFRTGLEGLQDQVPPRPFEEIEQRIRRISAAGRTSSSRGSSGVRSPALRSARCTRPSSRTGRASRSRCSTRTSTRSPGSISRRSAASWPSCRCSFPCRGSTPTTTRFSQMIAEELDFQREATTSSASRATSRAIRGSSSRA